MYTRNDLYKLLAEKAMKWLYKDLPESFVPWTVSLAPELAAIKAAAEKGKARMDTSGTEPEEALAQQAKDKAAADAAVAAAAQEAAAAAA